MDNPYRKEIQSLLLRISSDRPPALRRSDDELFLYATDLPMVSSAEEVNRFILDLGGNGWTAGRKGDWILLKRNIYFPPDEMIPVPGPEADCCLSLQLRQSKHLRQSDGAAELRLIKSAEQGRDEYERACRELHGRWSADLRMKRKIPQIDLLFFTGGLYRC